MNIYLIGALLYLNIISAAFRSDDNKKDYNGSHLIPKAIERTITKLEEKQIIYENENENENETETETETKTEKISHNVDDANDSKTNPDSNDKEKQEKNEDESRKVAEFILAVIFNL
jgi:hypothetical protein